MIVKLAAESAAGDAMKMLGGYVREVAFYRFVAGRAPIGTPHVYAARIVESCEYLDLLSSHGVSDYSFDEAWRHYRYAVAYFMVLPTMPLLIWDSLPERSRQLCMRLVERAVATIDETDALEVFA